MIQNGLRQKHPYIDPYTTKGPWIMDYLETSHLEEVILYWLTIFHSKSKNLGLSINVILMRASRKDLFEESKIS